MASFGDILIATLFLALFAGLVYVAYMLRGAIKSAIESNKENMQAKGFTYKDGRIAYKSKNQLTQDEYIQKQRDALLRGGKLMSQPGATSFKTASQDSGVRSRNEVPTWAT